MSKEMLEAAIGYKARGFVVQPLSRPDDKGNSPGKRPILDDWQNLKETPDDLGAYIKKDYNIGNVCGKASGVDALDLDSEIFKDELLKGVGEIKTLISGHRAGRGHILFQHENDMFSEKHHFIGIEYFGNNAEGAGSNLVLPPSVHESGEVYRWLDPDAPLMKIPDKLKQNILALFKKEDALHEYFIKCRYCFTKGSKKYDKSDPRSKGLWARPDNVAVHGMDGRLAVLAIMGELKTHGCTNDLMQMACRRFFGKDYDFSKTEAELTHIEAIPPKCETLRKYLNVDCEGCSWRPKGYSETTLSTTCADCVFTPRGGAGNCRNPENEDKATKQKKFVVYDSAACDKFKIKILKSENKNPEVQESEPDKTPQHIVDKAKEISETGDPLAFLLNTHQTIHIGDKDNAEYLFCAVGVQSCRNSAGLHTQGSGNSGMGKTHTAKAVLHEIPKEFKIHGSSSDKAFYYEDMKPGTVIFLDDTVLSESMEGVIKRSTSNFQEGDFHRTLDANRNPVTLYIPPRVSWWLTSVNNTNSVQVLNRQIILEPDEGEKQDGNICTHQQEMAEEGLLPFPENDDVLICREIIRDIKLQLYIVKIPFAKAITWHDMENRRSQDMFFDLIRGLCIIHHRQRFTDESGALIANLEDYREALRLYKLRSQTQKTKLNKSELKVLQAILDNPEGIDSSTLQKNTKLSKTRLSQVLNGEKGRTGLFEKVSGLTQDKASITEKDIDETSYRSETSHLTIYKVVGLSKIEEYNNVADLDEIKLSSAPVKSAKLLNLWQQIAKPENLTWLNWLNWSAAYRPYGLTAIIRHEKQSEQEKNDNNQEQGEAQRKEEENNIKEPVKPVKPELSHSCANENKEEINNSNNDNQDKLSQLSSKDNEGKNDINSNEPVKSVEPELNTGYAKKKTDKNSISNKNNRGKLSKLSKKKKESLEHKNNTCGLCGEDIDTEEHEFAGKGRGNIHVRCKNQPIKVKALTSVSFIKKNTHKQVQVKKGEVFDIPALQALDFIRSRVVERALVGENITVG